MVWEETLAWFKDAGAHRDLVTRIEGYMETEIRSEQDWAKYKQDIRMIIMAHPWAATVNFQNLIGIVGQLSARTHAVLKRHPNLGTSPRPAGQVSPKPPEAIALPVARVSVPARERATKPAVNSGSRREVQQPKEKGSMLKFLSDPKAQSEESRIGFREDTQKRLREAVIKPPEEEKLRQDLEKGSAKEAMRIASSVKLRKLARDKLEQDFYAENTWLSHASEVKLYCSLMKAMSFSPFPVTYQTLKEFASILKSAGYRSGEQYICAVMRENRLRGHLPDPHVEQGKVDILRSVRRGKGDDFHMAPISQQMLLEMREQVRGEMAKYTWKLAVVEWFFLLRSAEARAIRPIDVEFIQGRKLRAVLFITKSKTNVSQRTVKRMLDCCCKTHDANPLKLCPVHCLKDLIESSGNARDEVMSPGKTTPQPDISGYVKTLRDLLANSGVKIVNDDNKYIYGTHSLRRGGAQALALAGWPIEMIKYFGRWLSDIIEVYLLDAPIKAMGHVLASTMLTGITGGGKMDAGGDFEIGPKKLVKGTRIRVWLRDMEAWGDHDKTKDLCGWMSVVVLATRNDTMPAVELAWHEKVPEEQRVWPTDHNVVIVGFEGSEVLKGIALPLESVYWLAEV